MPEGDIEAINKALKNWIGFDDAERWWLYTMTNAATGRVDDRKGWRKAVKCILIDDK